MIIEMLQNWYFIDSVLLNDHAKYAITEKRDYQEYVSLKAALLSDLTEFYNHIEYKPENNIPSDHKSLQESARKLAIKTKSISARMLENKQMVKHMQKVIREQFEKKPNTDFAKLSDCVINERFTKMCLDNILVGKPMLVAGDQEKVSDFKAEILEQSYLTIRSDMIKISRKYSNSFNEASLAKYGLISVAGFMLAGAVARSIESFSNRCENRCGTLRLNTAAKKACGLKCKIQTQQKIIASLRQSAAQSNNVQARNRFAKDVKRAQLRMTQHQRQLAKTTATRAGADSVDPSDRSRTY
jgi:hypothetical protein